MEKRNKYIRWFVFPVPLHFALDDFDNKKNNTQCGDNITCLHVTTSKISIESP